MVRLVNKRMRLLQTVEKVKIRLRRRTCADDGDTSREILRQIVCEELCSECAICRKILSKGFSKGEIDALGAAVRGCCPFCSVSSFSTRCGVPLYGRLVPAAGSRRERCGAARLYRAITASMMLSSTPTCTRQSAVTSWPSASLPPGRRMPRGAPASSASGKTGSRYRPWKP